MRDTCTLQKVLSDRDHERTPFTVYKETDSGSELSTHIEMALADKIQSEKGVTFALGG